VLLVRPEDEARAKQLFFEYDGSEFYMDRDGFGDEYTALNVPKTVRREWMRELTAKHLAGLDEPGNWRTINFLSHHCDYSHVAEVLRAEPKGVWWERVAYLEGLLDYVRKARWRLRASGKDRAATADIALKYGELLLAEADEQEDRDVPGGSAEDRRRRVSDLLREARRHVR
jgi:hypothetical protein